MFTRSIVFAAALSAAPLAVSAQEWAFDPSHTSVAFKVGHMGFSEITGFFREFDADVAFDPDDLAATEVTFSIAADSVDTLWPARDEHLKTADFLDVANHPEITFVSTAIEPIDDTTATVIGNLTIRGVTQEVALDATLNQVGPNPFNPEQQIAGFTLTGEIDRTDFGVDFGAPAIGAVLPLTINVELIQGG